MKLVLFLIFAAFTMTVFQGVAQAGGGSTELYSWKDKKGKWLFVLANGTNRQKTEMEVKKEWPQYKGTADLKKALERLPSGEEVLWSEHFLTGFEFPPEDVRKEIAKAASEAKIKIDIELDMPIEPSLIEDKVSLALGEAFTFEFQRVGDRLVKPTKSKGTDAKKEAVHIKLATTSDSPFPPPREGATRPYLSLDNNFDQSISFRVLVRKKDPNNKYHAAFEKLSNDKISLPAGEAMNKCWGFDALVEEVVLYDFKLSDTAAK